MEFSWPKDMRRLQLVGLVVLAVVTLIVSVLALTRYREPVPQAATPAPQTQDAASWPADEPAEESEPAPEPEPLTPLQEVGVRLAEPGASVMVIGDGTGNEDDEWVAVWARDYLALDRGVNYRLWDRYGLRWAEPVVMGQGAADLDVWNASVLAPEMAQEPARVQQAWQPVSAVFLSYGHWRDPATVGAELSAILDVIRTQDPEVPVVVILQNPGPWSVAEAQQANVRAVDEWAQQNGLPTLDVYNGFPADQGQRDALLEADGSPTLDGSRLYASIVAGALAPAA